MGSLEVQVASVLCPMMVGEPIELRRGDVRVLRAWATKTALNFGYAAKGLEIEMPANVGQVLYQGRADYGVPPGTEVWVAAYDDPLETFAFRHMLSRGSGRHPVTGEEHRLLRVISVAGSAVFYVRVPDLLRARSMQRTGTLQQFTPLFDFPEGKSIPWRREGLDDAGISETMNRHVEAGLTPNEHLQVWKAPPGADDL